MTTTILAVLGAISLILQTATRLPAALTELLRSLQPLRDALHDLRAPLPTPPKDKEPAPSATRS